MESWRWKCCSRLSSLWVRSAEHGRSAKNRGKTTNTTAATAAIFAGVMGDLAVMMMFGVLLSERGDAVAALLQVAVVVVACGGKHARENLPQVVHYLWLEGFKKFTRPSIFPV